MKREGAKPNRRVRIEKLKLGDHFQVASGAEYEIIGDAGGPYVRVTRIAPIVHLFPKCRLVKRVKA